MLNSNGNKNGKKIINCSKGVVKQATNNLQLVLQHCCKTS